MSGLERWFRFRFTRASLDPWLSRCERWICGRERFRVQGFDERAPARFYNAFLLVTASSKFASNSEAARLSYPTYPARRCLALEAPTPAYDVIEVS